MVIYTKKGTFNLTIEKVLSTICFLAALAFLVAALSGVWRHLFTMGLCIAVGIMITDDKSPEEQEKRH